MGLRIIRATSLAAAEMLKDYLLPDIDGVLSKDDLVVNLKNWLTYAPGQTLLLICLEGTKIEAFGLAAAPQVGNYILIDQVWCSELAQRAHIAEKFFDIVRVWAGELGRTRIRMETIRDPGALTRKFNFRLVSTTMELSLDTTNEMIGDTNGNIGQAENDVKSDQPAEDNQQRDHGLASGEAVPGSDSVESAAAGTVQQGVQHDSGQ